jgi:hypothetical protein
MERWSRRATARGRQRFIALDEEQSTAMRHQEVE